MHEASLVMGMIPTIEKSLNENNGKKVNKVTVTIGKLAGVELNTFRFAYDSLKTDHEWLKDSELVINEVPILYRCSECGHEFESEKFKFPDCPKCASYGLSMIKGEELYLESLEIEEGD